MDVTHTLLFLMLGLVMGAVGQGARTVVGLRKATGDPASGGLDARRLAVNLSIGAVAGTLGAVALLGNDIDKTLLLTLVATGYAGADFIEGFIEHEDSRVRISSCRSRAPGKWRPSRGKGASGGEQIYEERSAK